MGRPVLGRARAPDRDSCRVAVACGLAAGAAGAYGIRLARSDDLRGWLLYEEMLDGCSISLRLPSVVFRRQCSSLEAVELLGL